jgi:hypothetical protein
MMSRSLRLCGFVLEVGFLSVGKAGSTDSTHSMGTPPTKSAGKDDRSFAFLAFSIPILLVVSSLTPL